MRLRGARESRDNVSELSFGLNKGIICREIQTVVFLQVSTMLSRGARESPDSFSRL